MPPLVFAGESRSLKKKLGEVSQGKAFLLQGGDCAESFLEFHPNNIRDFFKVVLQMSLILTVSSKLPVIKVGRVAGQFSKPRSSPVEVIDGKELPSYLGDNINSMEFTKESLCVKNKFKLSYKDIPDTLYDDVLKYINELVANPE